MKIAQSRLDSCSARWKKLRGDPDPPLKESILRADQLFEIDAQYHRWRFGPSWRQCCRCFNFSPVGGNQSRQTWNEGWKTLRAGASSDLLGEVTVFGERARPSQGSYVKGNEAIRVGGDSDRIDQPYTLVNDQKLRLKSIFLSANNLEETGISLCVDLLPDRTPRNPRGKQSDAGPEHIAGEPEPIFHLQSGVRGRIRSTNCDQPRQNDGEADQPECPESLIPLPHTRSMSDSVPAVESHIGNLS